MDKAIVWKEYVYLCRRMIIYSTSKQSSAISSYKIFVIGRSDVIVAEPFVIDQGQPSGMGIYEYSGDTSIPSP